MKRYEYNVLCRLVVKAETQAAGDKALEDGSHSYWHGEVGRIVREDVWFQLPGEEVIEAKPVPFSNNAVDPAILRLRAYFKQNKISKALVARRLKVNTGSIYGWLAGKWIPSPEAIKKIKQFLTAEQ